MSLDVCVTVDLEQDCPPYLHTYRGMEKGFSSLIELLDASDVPATFFCTGDVAQRFPDAVRLLATQHELGCHGMTHGRFTEMSMSEARQEIATSTEILRAFAPVTSFRAPYLSFPNEYLPVLVEAGFTADSSQAAYKPAAHWAGPGSTGLRRIRATIPPSVIRLPAIVRNAVLTMLRSPVVLFFHPWEFVDFRGAKELPLDCRFATGEHALRSLRETIGFFRRRGATFKTVAELRV